jgi:hypothetical protein
LQEKRRKKDKEYLINSRYVIPSFTSKEKRKNLVNKKEEEEDSKKSSKHVEMKLLKKYA